MIWRIQWQSPQWIWLVAITLAALLAGVLLIYRGQSNFYWLPVLRMTALAVLVVSILRPVILTPIRDEQRGIVVVLIDQSKSMSVVDKGRSPAQLVKLAASLGLISESVRPSSLSDLRTQIDDLREIAEEIGRSKAELEYARLAGRGIEAADARLRDASSEMKSRVAAAVKVSPEALAGLTLQIDSDVAPARISQVLERIEEMQSVSDAQLYSQNAEVRNICRDIALEPRINLARQALIAKSGLINRLAGERRIRVFGFDQSLVPISTPIEQIPAEGTGSDLPVVLGDLRQRMTGQPIGAIVILSDGGNIAGRAIDTPPLSDIPTYAINMAAPGQRDLSLGTVALPTTAFLGETIQIRVEVQAVRFDGQVAQVVVESGEQYLSKPVTISGNSGFAQFSLTANRPGIQEITLNVSPLEGEITSDNNQAHKLIKVIADPLHVALLSSADNPSSQFFKQLFLDKPEYVLMAPVSVDGRTTASADQILGQDLVILSELPAAGLNARQWDALNQLLRQRGGSVLIATGQPAIAAGYASHPTGGGLVPWRPESMPSLRSWPGQEPVFHMVPAAEAIQYPPWQSNWGEYPVSWDELPAMFRFLSLPPLRAGARSLLVERESTQPILSELSIGPGRAYFLGVDEMWRWRDAAVRLPSEFWRHFIQYMVQPPYSVTSGQYALDADKLELEPGTPLHVRTRMPSDATVPAILQIWREGDPAGVQEIPPQSQNAGRFDFVLSDLQAGSDELRLVWDNASHSLSLPIRVESTFEREMRDLAGSDVPLIQATGSRNDVFGLDNIDALVERLIKVKGQEPRFAERTLWDSPYLFAFVLACLGLEWSLRKRAGLV
ncbi:MAG TPA: hypothetical protein VHD56_04830 [Tepidisphaeraceae bacterium]|nr:hypothetical protein [Tepidisphaeraceae bacterium]